MDFANYWFSGFGGEDPGPGFSIENSLRFRGAQRIFNTTISYTGNSTTSFWMKLPLGPETGAVRQAIYGNGTGSGTLIWHEIDSTLITRIDSSTGTAFTPGAVYRDPSAWYHVVLQKDNNNITLSYVLAKCTHSFLLHP